VKLVYKVTGRKLKPANVERAVKLSAEKYCSATAMFAKSAAIEHSFEIIEDGEGEGA
jgi:putative redox protein